MTMTSPQLHVWDGSGDESAAAEVALAETLASLPAHDVTSPRQDRRNDVIQIAATVIDGEITEVAALDALTLYHPGLDEDVRAEHLGLLMGELEIEQQIEDHEINPEPGQTRDDLAQNAEDRINRAADALIGGTA